METDGNHCRGGDRQHLHRRYALGKSKQRAPRACAVTASTSSATDGWHRSVAARSAGPAPTMDRVITAHDELRGDIDATPIDSTLPPDSGQFRNLGEETHAEPHSIGAARSRAAPHTTPRRAQIDRCHACDVRSSPASRPRPRSR